ncbi:Transposase (or an inactivated derivative) [Saccharopolyspora flava]|uniref:Mutator family transposase n=1 Tax=Saccharopolyspora flava TaxID=95161 RepID=A0A1I6V796_9PSEU|nr:Transposase (or an inactivated derivative) [Saccharopolyspora flava]
MTDGDTTASQDDYEDRPGSGGLDVQLARELIERAQAEGVSLVGPGGLLAGVTRTVLQTALEAEMTEHLGYDKGDPAGRGAGNHRNGSSAKTVHTEVGPVPIEVPRDRRGEFEPQIVPKHARRIAGFDEAVISLYAKGLTTGEIQAHLAEIYQTEVSKDLISRITDQVVDELKIWQNRPLDRVYPVMLIDAIHVKIREGQVTNRPIYVVVGINCQGERDVLGLWVGTGGEGAKQWMSVLTELKNRGVADVLIACCDGLKGLPEAINEVWPLATVQECVVHLVRASLRYAARSHWGAITKALRTVYTAPTVEAAQDRFDEFEQTWGAKYPAIIRLWRSSWEQFTPFLAFPPDIRKIIYTTNAVESLNARFRQATRRRGHFPSEQAALKVLYLVIRTPQRNRSNVTGRTHGWKQALNTLVMFYGDRISLN